MDVHSHQGISIYYATSDGRTWAAYLQDKLDKDYAITTELNDIENQQFQIKSTKANVFLFTPDCVEVKDWYWATTFDSETSIAVLTGITHKDFQRIAAKRHVAQYFDSWLTYEVEQTDSSVRELIVAIIGVFEHEAGSVASSPSHSSSTFEYLALDSQLINDNTYDRLPPSKARQVNRLHQVFCTQPGRAEEDLVYVVLDRPADEELLVRFEHKPAVVRPKFLEYKAVYTFPRPDSSITDIDVHLGHQSIGKGTIPHPPSQRQLTRVATEDDPDYVAPETDTYLVPDSKRSITRDRETNNNNVREVSLLDQLSDLLSRLMDPKLILCQCLGVSAESQLDDKMAAMLDISSMELLPLTSATKVPSEGSELNDSKWPTLLHFGAEYNLFNFCETLLNNRLMYSACWIKNKDGLYPHQLAMKAGNQRLGQMLEMFADFVREEHMDENQSKSKKEGHDSGYMERVPRLSAIMQYRASVTSDTSVTSPASHTPQTPSPPQPHILVSQISDAPPPRPHTVLTHSYSNDPEFDAPVPRAHGTTTSMYLPMGATPQGQQEEDHCQTNQSSDRVRHKPPQPAPKPRKSLLKDVGLGNSIEEAEDTELSGDQRFTDSVRTDVREGAGLEAPEGDEEMGLATPVAEMADPFPSIINISKNNFDNPSSRVTMPPDMYADDVSSSGESVGTVTISEDFQSKDFSSDDDTLPSLNLPSPTERSPTSTQSDKKHGKKFFRLFHRGRSQSEPNITQVEAVTRKKPPTTYRKTSECSARSSDASSTSSTYSDSSGGGRMSEEVQMNVEVRSKKAKEKSKSKIGFFFKSAPRRKSMRLSHAIAAKNLEAPKLPAKKDERF